MTLDEREALEAIQSAMFRQANGTHELAASVDGLASAAHGIAEAIEHAAGVLAAALATRGIASAIDGVADRIGDLMRPKGSP